MTRTLGAGILLAFVILIVRSSDVCSDDLCHWEQQDSSPLKLSPLDLEWVPHPTEPFSISAGELTVGQYKTCIADGHCTKAHSSAQGPCPLGDKSEGAEKLAMTCISWEGCKEACEWAGGRLCKETEWTSSCKPAHNIRYPYGEKYIEGLCNLGLYADHRKIAAPGSYAGCVGGLPGLYDMLGNAGEWLDEGSNDYRKFRSSSFAHNGPLDLDCTPRCGGNDKSFYSHTIGCRCCKKKE